LRLEIDSDRDGRVDQWEYFGEDHARIRAEFDCNRDGRPDRWDYFSPASERTRIDLDENFDGSVDSSLGPASDPGASDARTRTDPPSDPELLELNLRNVSLRELVTTMESILSRGITVDAGIDERITLISETPVSADTAFSAFEGALQLKGLEVIETAAGQLKVQRRTR